MLYCDGCHKTILTFFFKFGEFKKVGSHGFAVACRRYLPFTEDPEHPESVSNEAADRYPMKISLSNPLFPDRLIVVLFRMDEPTDFLHNLNIDKLRKVNIIQKFVRLTNCFNLLLICLNLTINPKRGCISFYSIWCLCP